MKTRAAFAGVVACLVLVGTAFAQPSAKFEKVYRAGKTLAAAGQAAVLGGALEVDDVSKARGATQRLASALDDFNVELAIFDDMQTATTDESLARSAYHLAATVSGSAVTDLKRRNDMLVAVRDPRRHDPALPAALRAPEWKDVIALGEEIVKHLNDAAGSVKEAEQHLLTKGDAKKPAPATKKAPAKKAPASRATK